MKIKKFISKDIVVVFLMAIILNYLRVKLFGSHSFIWLYWNIFLAIIPFIISSILFWLLEEKKLKKVIFIIGGILWLLFIPNAPYLITDFIHLGVVRSVPILYDVFLLFSFAWLGMYIWLYSTFQIEQIIRSRFSKHITEIILFLVILSTSFGICLGRFLRLNSWDIFSDSAYFLKIIHQKFIISGDFTIYLYVSLITLFLFCFYKAFTYRKLK
jgi:uncharacterized membrane protein